MASVDEPVFIAAPDLPSGAREALVITTSTYADPKLRQLRSPVEDAEGLAAVLADPAVGGFKVSTLIDQTQSSVRREIAAFLTGRKPDETVLIYLSCHGIQDARGRLLFAASDTETQYLRATTVHAADVLDELDECNARRQILILDCCFSGSFSDSKSGRPGEPDLERQLRGHSRGREVLTASRSFEYSFEGEPLDGAITGSVFTTGLIDGLRTGEADTDNNGQVTVEEAYGYAFAHVQRSGAAQTPQRWLFGGEGSKIVLARSAAGRAVTPSKLPEHVLAALDSPAPNVRIGGVNTLAEWLTDTDPARQLAALRALEEVVEKEVRLVGQAATSHLERMRPAFGSPPGQFLTVVPERADWVPGSAAGVLTGPNDFIAAMEFSPDGRFLAMASDDGTTQLREMIGRGNVRVLDGHDGEVIGLDFSRSGALLATTGGDGEARLWEVATGAQVHVLQGHAGPIRGQHFSFDGALLATAGEDGRTLLWDVESGKFVRALRDPRQLRRQVGAWGARFSPDGALLVTATEDGIARLWGVSSGQAAQSLSMEEDGLAGFALSPDGALLALIGENGRLWLWDVARAATAHVLDEHDDSINNCEFSPDGALLATVSNDGTARLWNVLTGEQVDSLEGHAGGVSSVAFSRDGELIATGGDDRTVRVWDADTGEQLELLEGHTARVFTVAFSPTDPLLASADDDGTVRLWR